MQARSLRTRLTGAELLRALGLNKTDILAQDVVDMYQRTCSALEHDCKDIGGL